MAEPFLRLVAKAFYKAYGNKICDFCFIFPNRRSETFFVHELSSISDSPILTPEMTTISEFLCDITGLIDVPKIEAILILYTKYKEIMGESAEDFDNFSYWGEIIFNDFNDVDKYLADPKLLFKNIKNIKDISSNYLTDEQQAAISEYFGDNWQPPYDNGRFWKDNPEDSDSDFEESAATKRFTQIWSILYDLYTRFNEELDSRGLSYSGKTYRNAVSYIKECGKEKFRHTQYVFVGFNVLSYAEYKIFKYLGDKGIADYYWDCNSPALTDKRNKARLFMERNVEIFKPKLDINEPVIDQFCPISIVGIPSNIGQVKYVPRILNELTDIGAIKDKDNAINTAIVLPDENLFLPLLDSIPEDFSNINVTIGFPLRLSSIATLISSISKMQRRARKSGDDFDYYKDDLTDVISHPFIQALSPDGTKRIMEFLVQTRLFYVPAQKVITEDPTLTDILRPLKSTKSTEDVISYLRNLIQVVEKNFIDSESISADSVEMGFITQYVESLNRLANILRKYDIGMNDSTFFHLLNRLLASETASFQGEPMKGLQIMGVLETRSLDFENLIILSMNEHIFPRKHYTQTFIPSSIRRAFRMATVEFQDCMYAYYFYRMISRAKNTYLLYDARPQALGSGEPSRYIKQLEVLYPQAPIRHSLASFNITVPKDIEISVEKDERILNILNKFKDPNSGVYLSASYINHYITCPLQFYFEKVEGLSIENNSTEFMDKGTLGTVVHDILKELYEDISKSKKDGYISPGDIEMLLHQKKRLSEVSLKSIDKHYINSRSVVQRELTGETQLIQDAILFLVEKILNYDKNLGGFRFIMAEKEEKLQWTIPNTLLNDSITVNIKMIIDRVDEVMGADGKKTIRIVDYKTGLDEVSVNGIDKLFDKDHKAMRQLLLYCNVYAKDFDINSPITPIIYKIRNIGESGFKVGKEQMTDFRTHKTKDGDNLNTEFLNRMYDVVSSLFDPDVPFTQTQDKENNCKFCKFTAFCHQ